MEKFNVLSVSLIVFILIAGYFVFRYIQQLKNRYKLLKHRHVCELLEVDGPVSELNYNRISDLWVSYRFNGEYDKFGFKQAVIKKFVKKINLMTKISDVVNFCLTFSETQRHHTLSQLDKKMISEIYSEVCLQTETRVMLLAHKRYDKLKVMHKGEEKDRLMLELGLLLDHSCISNYFPLSKTILDLEVKLLLQKATLVSQQKRKKVVEAPVVEMRESGNPSETAVN